MKHRITHVAVHQTVHPVVHHAAGVQHVIVDRAQGPIPVSIVNQDPIAHATATIATWALAIAVLTLIAVAYQIYVARRSLSAIKQDLYNNRRMIDDALRTPKFRATQWSEFKYPSDRRDWINAMVVVSLANEGDKLTPALLLELLVPQDSAYNALRPGHAEGRTVNGVYYRVIGAQYNHILFPNDIATEINRFQFSIKPGVQTFTCLWRAYDIYGRYPQEEYGQWTFSVRV
ncbi:MAG: hypothetical protein JO322_11050 [Candidatus Eremiobacteraeota bacterium]|nr:hypothetical protein [Candidatus Eremiobacteraeota bacterium]